nr:SDR family oxidoreductase [Spirochaetota bacterium]
HYNRSLKEAETTAKMIEEFGVEVKLFKADLSDEKQTSSLISEVKNVFPEFSILINSASVFTRKSLKDTDNNLFNDNFNINLKAPFILTREFALLCKKGDVINILDSKISNNLSSHFAYSLFKKGLKELTTISAKELAPDIRVNALAPGLILPPDGEDFSYMNELSKKIPQKKVGRLCDITNGIVFLQE